MEPVNNSQTPSLADFEWFGPPVDAEPREIPDEPPLGELDEDDWAWLLSYKYDEWLELNAHFRSPCGLHRGTTTQEVARLAERKRTFEYVRSMYDQGLPPQEWTGFIPGAAAQYAYFDKQCSQAQKDYLQAVANGEIMPNFPDLSDEAEEHRGQPRQWS